MLIEALRDRKPDVIVVQKEPADFETWKRADAEIDALLKPYREAFTTPEMLVLRRDGS
jgi:predicted glycosyltransferase